MKVLCISKLTDVIGHLNAGNGEYTYLTEGKLYDAEPYGLNHYIIVDDSGDKRFYPNKNFESLKEFRERKLNDIL